MNFRDEVMHEALLHKKKGIEREDGERRKLVERWERFRDAHNRVRRSYGELEGIRVAVSFHRLGRFEGLLKVMGSVAEVELEPLPFAYPFMVGLYVNVPVGDHKLEVPLALFCGRWDYHERQNSSKKVQYAEDHAFWVNLLGGEDLCTDAVLTHAMARVKRDVEVLDLPDDYTPVPDDARGLDL